MSSKKRQRRRKSGSLLIAIGMLMLLSAAILTSLNFIEDGQAGEAAGNALEQLLLAERDARDAARAGLLRNFFGRTRRRVRRPHPRPRLPERQHLHPRRGDAGHRNQCYGYIGVLQIPSLDLTLPVISDWSYPALQIAPCRYEGSAYDGGMVIAGHNFDSHFGNYLSWNPAMKSSHRPFRQYLHLRGRRDRGPGSHGYRRDGHRRLGPNPLHLHPQRADAVHRPRSPCGVRYITLFPQEAGRIRAAGFPLRQKPPEEVFSWRFLSIVFFFPFSQLPQQFSSVIPRKINDPIIGQIVQVKTDKRFTVIQKDKVCPEPACTKGNPAE